MINETISYVDYIVISAWFLVDAIILGYISEFFFKATRLRFWGICITVFFWMRNLSALAVIVSTAWWLVA